jgi:ATP-dependent Clp protease ATP-binding subunit ClpC
MKRLAVGIALIACLRVSAQKKSVGNTFTEIAQLQQLQGHGGQSADMFERYTETARRVIFFARYEVSQSGGMTIESEHLLLGLVREDEAVVTRFVRDASLAALRDEITGRMTVKEKVPTSVDLPLSDECKRILAYTAEEAERLNSAKIGPEHLLLGMLREEKSTAALILYGHGLKLDVVREALARDPIQKERLR